MGTESIEFVAKRDEAIGGLNFLATVTSEIGKRMPGVTLELSIEGNATFDALGETVRMICVAGHDGQVFVTCFPSPCLPGQQVRAVLSLACSSTNSCLKVKRYVGNGEAKDLELGTTDDPFFGTAGLSSVHEQAATCLVKAQDRLPRVSDGSLATWMRRVTRMGSRHRPARQKSAKTARPRSLQPHPRPFPWCAG